MRNLAIIPARSGSKGLPDKNIKPFVGKPLISYTIAEALKSGCFQEVIVSTDSEKYAEIAKQFGANIPFLRSQDTSSDVASSWDVVNEVLLSYERIGKKFDTFTLLQPTSPLRSACDIQAAFKMLSNAEAQAVVSVCKADHPLAFFNHIPPSGSLASFVKAQKSLRRQDVDTDYFRINGAIYLVRIPFFEQSHMIYREGCYALEMNKLASIDIDDELDFIQAEAIYKYANNEII